MNTRAAVKATATTAGLLGFAGSAVLWPKIAFAIICAGLGALFVAALWAAFYEAFEEGQC